jgi:hypothetical protein
MQHHRPGDVRISCRGLWQMQAGEKRGVRCHIQGKRDDTYPEQHNGQQAWYTPRDVRCRSPPPALTQVERHVTVHERGRCYDQHTERMGRMLCSIPCCLFPSWKCLVERMGRMSHCAPQRVHPLG